MLKETGNFSRLSNEEQNTKEGEHQGDEEGVRKVPVVGFDYWSVLVLSEYPKHQRCDEKKKKSRDSQTDPQRFFKREEAYIFRKAVIFLLVWVLIFWTMKAVIDV